MYALVDANAFYVSCERVFDTTLRRKPVIVSSNNDGCAVARSDEAKALGVKMGHPVHELRDLIRRHGLIIRSSNFCLYGDMSRRMVDILRDAAPRVEVYSVDESFVDFSGVRNAISLAEDLRAKIRRWIGIPTCVGLGPTKTLAKAANRLAKRGRGVVDLTNPVERDEALQDFPVEDIWGVGGRWAAALSDMGIRTAAQLRDAPGDVILGRFGIVLRRTQRELQGHSCIALQEVEPDRQQIVVSRSFGERVEDHEAVAQALATFAVRAAEKLRTRGLVCAAVGIMASTDVFRAELPQHHPSRACGLVSATNDSIVIARAVRAMFDRKFLRAGYAYKKAGIVLQDLARPEALQGDLFAAPTQGKPALMSVLDDINRRFGRGAAGIAATGWKAKPAWGMRQNALSPAYTTKASDFPEART